jgi:hypothetical protein
MRPYVKKPHHKSGLVEWLKVVGPEFKPQYHQKKKKKKRKSHFSNMSVTRPGNIVPCWERGFTAFFSLWGLDGSYISLSVPPSVHPIYSSEVEQF